MSDAKDTSQDVFSINLCSQCLQPFQKAESLDARHAVPCGHVFCKDCLRRVEEETKSGTLVCRKPGCGKKLAKPTEFPVAWCTQRAHRVKVSLAALLADQGDVGDFREAVSEQAEAKHTSILCAQHKLPVRGVEASTYRPLCLDCVTEVGDKVAVQTFDEAIAALDTYDAAAADLAEQKKLLAEPTPTADDFQEITARWGAAETLRIRMWEAREVKHVQAVADKTVKLIDEVCARRMEAAASVLTQRRGLRASLEELDEALSDLPSDPFSRLSKKRALYADRKQLCELLTAHKIAVPSADAIFEWAKLPALTRWFGKYAAETTCGFAESLSANAADALHTLRLSCPGTLIRPPDDWREFPVIPKLVRCCGAKDRV